MLLLVVAIIVSVVLKIIANLPMTITIIICFVGLVYFNSSSAENAETVRSVSKDINNIISTASKTAKSIDSTFIKDLIKEDDEDVQESTTLDLLH